MLPRQDVSRYFGLSGLIRPHRSLSLNLGYRATLRDVLTAPDVDLTNVHLNITFRMGLLTIEGNWYRNESSVLGGPLEINHGFRWSVRRTFGGWLPIVSAPKRNGVIR